MLLLSSSKGHTPHPAPTPLMILRPKVNSPGVKGHGHAAGQPRRHGNGSGKTVTGCGDDRSGCVKQVNVLVEVRP